MLRKCSHSVKYSCLKFSFLIRIEIKDLCPSLAAQTQTHVFWRNPECTHIFSLYRIRNGL